MRRWVMAAMALSGVMGLVTSGTAQAALPEVVEVVKPYGAPLRGEPTSAAGIAYVAACGEWLTVVGERDGWYQVYSRAAYYWVGGARVADVQDQVEYDCGGGFTFQPYDLAQAIVESGCLSVRAYPSASAPYDACVERYHRFFVTNGPIEVDGEDWLEVWSDATGRGWARARYLFPVE